MNVRLVATGHDLQGKAVVASDTEVTPETISLLPGMAFHRLWGADRPPVFPDNGTQPANRDYFPPVGGFRFMMFTVPPHSSNEHVAGDPQTLVAEMESKLPGFAAHMERNDPGMHTTNTIDFDYIISGEIWLELDNGVVVHLRAGDAVVQSGTRHAWRNKGTEPCQIVVFMVGVMRDPLGVEAVQRASGVVRP